MRSAVLTGLSFMLTAAVIGNAYYQRQQFYPSVVYITKSNPSMAVIYIQSFVFVILVGKLMRKIFFGRLRAAEFEHLMERSWYAVTETCLAFTVFKDDFSPKFVALFTLLLFLKSFHWLAEDRVDYMERSPVISALFHLRVLSLAILLATIDINFISYAYHSTLTKGASVQLVFGFEYAVLLTIVVNTLVKYVLHCIDLYSENPWERKAVFMLYTELVIGFIKVLLYVLFIVIMVRIYTLPLFAVRPMYLTMRAFKKAFNDVILSRRAIHNMNTWYPDATPEELAATDNVCIICREEMLAPSTKKLPCNHIFHKNCLRSWFQRQQTCPTCRLDVLRAPIPGSAADAAQARQQQQQQQPQQQPPPPQQQQPPFNFPGFDPNFFAQMHHQQHAAAVAAAGGAAPPPRPTATPTQRPPPTTGAAVDAASGSGSASINNNTIRPPFMFPPFPFFPPPFTVPPPMPPPNFAGLTDEELRAMEGQERENVESRIRCLRNIQVLLDAAVMEMHQYSSVVAQLNRTGPTSTPSTSSNSNNTPVSTEPSSTAAAASTEETVTPSVTSSPTSSTSNATTSTTESVRGPFSTPAETGAKPKTKAASPTVVDEQQEIIEKMDKEDGTDSEREEIRKRRLAKFEQLD